MLDRAETLLHDHYAGQDYWNVSHIVCYKYFNKVHDAITS